MSLFYDNPLLRFCLVVQVAEDAEVVTDSYIFPKSTCWYVVRLM